MHPFGKIFSFFKVQSETLVIVPATTCLWLQGDAMSCLRRCKPGYDVSNGRLPSFVLLLCIILLVARGGDCHHRRKGFMQHLENFFCSVDQDGDGEIEHHEVAKFLSLFDAKMNSVEEPNGGNGGGKDAMQDFIMSYNFKGDFSYGGTTISAEEMLDHLQNMLTADRVVEWITHGLQLPQYAQAFRQNAVNGLDFPALIEDHSQTLSDELGVQSSFHRKKITHAIVRQMFGLGAVPGPPVNVQCASARCGGIQLHWDSPSFCGYPPLHKYLIQKRADNASSWVHTCDITENSFLDHNGILPGKFYTYKIQAWGGHGPSEWVQIHGCHGADTLNSDEHCYVPPVAETAGIVSIVRADGQISSSDLKVLNVSAQKSAGWGWMYLVNGFLLFLGIISRQSLFFHITSAGWILFRKKFLSTMKMSVMEARNSQYLLIRIIGHTFARVCAFWQLMQTSIGNLSVQLNGIHSGTSVVRSCSPSWNLITDTDNYHGAVGFSTTDKTLEDMTVASCYQDTAFSSNVFSGIEGWMPDLNKVQYADLLQTKTDGDLDDSRNSVLDTRFLKAGELENPIKTNPVFKNEKMPQGKNTEKIKSTQTTCNGKHLRVDDSRQENMMQSCERAENCTEPSSVSTHARDCRRKEELFTIFNRNRFRCNFEGCKVRFDRWHSLSDWQMKFRKHYCRECQRVFCIRHTRISPHGPFGQCGLESNCVCTSCFEGLSLEAQRKLEQINKLRVGPYISNDTFHHEKRWRTNPILNTASTHTKVQKSDRLIKDDWLEAKYGSCLGRNNVNDSYPPNLYLPYSDDSSDDSLSDSSCMSSGSSSCSTKIASGSSDHARRSSRMPSEVSECM